MSSVTASVPPQLWYTKEYIRLKEDGLLDDKEIDTCILRRWAEVQHHVSRPSDQPPKAPQRDPAKEAREAEHKTAGEYMVLNKKLSASELDLFVPPMEFAGTTSNGMYMFTAKKPPATSLKITTEPLGTALCEREGLEFVRVQDGMLVYKKTEADDRGDGGGKKRSCEELSSVSDLLFKLKNDTLDSICDTFECSASGPKRTKIDNILATAESGSVSDLAASLNFETIKMMCKDLGLVASKSAKAELVAKIAAA